MPSVSTPCVRVSPVPDISYFLSMMLCARILSGGNFFLQHYNGVPVIPSAIIVFDPELFACDTCLDACGVVCFGELFRATFPSFIVSQHLNINQLELLTILVCLKLW